MYVKRRISSRLLINYSSFPVNIDCGPVSTYVSTGLDVSAVLTGSGLTAPRQFITRA